MGDRTAQQELMAAAEAHRKEKGLKAWAFAAGMRMGATYYSLLVNGNRQPSRNNLQAMAEAYPELRIAVARYWRKLDPAAVEGA